VIDAISTSLVRQGTSNLTAYDAQISGDLFDLPAGKVAMATGLEYREESIKDIPDEQFQRGLIFGTEAVSAQASRDSWSAFIEFAVPVLDTLEVNLAARYDDYSDFGNTTNPKISARWRRSKRWRSARPGARVSGRRRSRRSASAPRRSRSSSPTPTAAPTTRRTAPRLITTSRSRATRTCRRGIGKLQRGCGLEAERHVAVLGRLLDSKQDKKIDEVQLRLPVLPVLQRAGQRRLRARHAAAGRYARPLQSVNSSFINIGEQSTNGVDVSAYFRKHGHGRRTVRRPRLLAHAGVQEARAGRGRQQPREPRPHGEYEYPEDAFVLTATGASLTGAYGPR